MINIYLGGKCVKKMDHHCPCKFNAFHNYPITLYRQKATVESTNVYNVKYLQGSTLALVGGIMHTLHVF